MYICNELWGDFPKYLSIVCHSFYFLKWVMLIVTIFSAGVEKQALWQLLKMDL